ncbi:endonuclease/exonuclease/phosphatase family protein [Portibacter lacus]|uniref:Endonuclease n=1 Tax=Portibacter lacus TaxID=1099794 RepID=A0AA37WBA9_9BACT|nr:endonuclease/exonuclease/phosphatase family protein [Portibacter lacus]GLR15446.1 endonuclease [Portibacter lacus]
MKYLILSLFLITAVSSNAQEKKYKISSIGFYNLENLFDINDDDEVSDTEFTPEGSKNWTKEKYNEKLGNLSSVIATLGTDQNKDGVAILGVSEVENRGVLEDLVKQRAIKKRNYQIIHEDSPDRRGIDVALLYQEEFFTPIAHKYHPLMIYRDDKRVYTRDVLYVSGMLDGEKIHVLVNHWPSRSGGEKRSRPLRNAAAKLNKMITDSIKVEEPMAKIFIMGDLNDDPTSPSLKNVLQARQSATKTPDGGFFNPMWAYYKKGIGSNAYRDAWSLFDQIVVSQALLPKTQEGFFYYKAVIHNPNSLVQPFGQYKGYPFRTFAGDTYISGYSDHFPVYVLLLKEIN